MIPSLAILLLVLAVPRGALAQIRDLDELQQGRHRLSQAVDSLQSMSVRLLALRDSVAAHADSLWAHDPESDDLVRLRLSYRLVVARLSRIDAHLDSLTAVRDSLDEGLRGSYDWEISRLFGMLEGGWDEGLFRQLLVFQREREELGNQIRASYYRLDDDQELAVRDEDGPEEIRQKVELAQDRVAEFQHEQREIERRLRFLDRDALVLQKIWHLRSERVSLQRARPGLERGLQVRDKEGGEMEVMPLPEGTSRRGLYPAVPGADSVAPPAPVDAQLLLEAQRLKARQQELREVEAVLQERIGAFHQRLAYILAGRQ